MQGQAQETKAATQWRISVHPFMAGRFCISRRNERGLPEHLMNELFPTQIQPFGSRDEARAALAKVSA